VQRFVGFDPAAAIPVFEPVWLGIDDASFYVQQAIVTSVTVAGYDSSMRQFTGGGVA
jgi:hypothetical protein